ncbi:hypothetical protein J5N58_08175 [Rhizobium cremeum]|uniref:hypothetical protein n=1 Tax=Rhizobium TaxID=379 RepID=UPI00163AC723|nr:MULTISPECIES: hypothetical protein [Rhizobium]MBC2773426.1 hypothetical protein [Rhizobium sp. AQ_MP]MCJ7995897.1 hypothetical protein [Rhizobium cremeum]MCJ7999652.1 hypothetical protein [Rhizobium cremeum]
MAFAGLHVTTGYVGPSYGRNLIKGAALLTRITGSESLASGGTTTLVAPADHEVMGPPIFRVQAAADSWVAIGPSPNASTGARTLCRAGEDYDFFAEPGWKVAWVAA